MLKEGSRGVLIRVTKWVAENMEGVVATKPAVYVAVALVDQLAMLMKGEESWRVILESIVTTLLEGDKVRNCFPLYTRARNLLLLIVGRGWRGVSAAAGLGLAPPLGLPAGPGARVAAEPRGRRGEGGGAVRARRSRGRAQQVQDRHVGVAETGDNHDLITLARYYICTCTSCDVVFGIMYDVKMSWKYICFIMKFFRYSNLVVLPYRTSSLEFTVITEVFEDQGNHFDIRPRDIILSL